MQRDIQALVQAMTLEEKAGMCSGADFWHLKGVERLGVPQVMVSDGPHGLRKQEEHGDHLGVHESIQAVCFPAACATAASFDEALLTRLGNALGEACRAQNISVLLGPAVNIKRSPLCGRNFEYFSEDPYLAGKLAAAQVRGIQKWNVGACLKHFAANNQEYRRMTCSSEVDERTLREIYLPAFEIAVQEAKPWTVMCSYNRINGVFASENEYLLTKILRRDWGFDGYVMSDWYAVNNRVAGLRAGLDLEMPASNGANDAKLVAAVRDGSLPEAVLDESVARILRCVFRYADASRQEARYDLERGHALAVELAKECGVLLQNRGALPLRRSAKTVYIGAFAQAPRYQGGGSSHINPYHVSNALAAARAQGVQVAYYGVFSQDGDSLDEAELAQALAAVQQADCAVIFAGLPDSFESEGYDRTHMRLPNCQNQVIQAVAQAQRNTVVVLHNGSPVELPWADEVNAILEMYLAGEGVGEAEDALLYGDANPSGRLPETFPHRLPDTPAYLNFPGDGETVQYAEGVYVGYRYYDAKEMDVRFPFGHGLSYTTFSYGDVRLSQCELKEGESLTVTVDVTNTGDCAGKETVQLYVQDCTGTPGRPPRELKGFQKISLAPGETKPVSFTLNSRSLAFYHTESGGWYAAGGTYQIVLAHSSRDIRAVAPLVFVPQKQLPLTVNENAVIGDLLADTRTAPVLQQVLAPFWEKNGTTQADASEMTRQMVLNSPMRAIRMFGNVPEEKFQALLQKLQQCAGESI